MRRHHSSTVLCCAMGLASTPLSWATDVSLAGTVRRPDASPLAGAVVRLVQAGLTATTDVRGEWMLTGTSGIREQESNSAAKAGSLRWENGRLRFAVDEHDLAGRRRCTDKTPADAPSSPAGRALVSTPDTLEYSYDGRVFLRDTISRLDVAGIVTTFDTTWNASIVYGTLRDIRDGRTYRTVKIGSQIWMAENLNFRVDSSFCYVDDTTNCNKFGRLYQWASALGLSDSCNTNYCATKVKEKMQGACPSGWHVASDAEWRKLTDTTLSVKTSGEKLKAKSVLWNQNIGTDEVGFRALTGGYINKSGSLCEPGEENYYWTATEYQGSYAWGRTMYTGGTNVIRSYGYKNSLFSIRCIQD